MKLKEIAIEVAKVVAIDINRNAIDKDAPMSQDEFKLFCTELVARSVAAVDAERGKDAVRYCYECGSIGETGEGFIDCCPDGSHAQYVHREIAKQAAEGFLSPAIPEGWKLLKDTTQEERSWPEDSSHENGKYYNLCCHCGRTFIGYKRRGLCKVCAELAAGVTK